MDQPQPAPVSQIYEKEKKGGIFAKAGSKPSTGFGKGPVAEAKPIVRDEPNEEEKIPSTSQAQD